MLTALLLTLMPAAHAEVGCDAAFHSKVAPADAPAPPPLRPLLDFVYDADDSGALDEAERKTLQADLVLRCQALDTLFAELDANGDGKLDDAEREDLHALFGPPPHRGPPKGDPGSERPTRPAKGQLPPPGMRAYDTDRSGELDDEERQAARADIQDRLRNGLPPFPAPERGSR